MPTREQIAQAIHDSCPHYIGSMADCMKAADDVCKLISRDDIARAIDPGAFTTKEVPNNCNSDRERWAVERWNEDTGPRRRKVAHKAADRVLAAISSCSR